MTYKGFFIRITKTSISRREQGGDEGYTDGYIIDIFTNETDRIPCDSFCAAVGYELLENSINEAEQLAKDYIDCEKK